MEHILMFFLGVVGAGVIAFCAVVTAILAVVRVEPVFGLISVLFLGALVFMVRELRLFAQQLL